MVLKEEVEAERWVWSNTWLLLLFFFFLHFMAGLHLQHMEVPGAKGQTEAVFVTATTMPDPSCI